MSISISSLYNICHCLFTSKAFSITFKVPNLMIRQININNLIKTYVNFSLQEASSVLNYYSSFEPQNHPKREFAVSSIFPDKEPKLKMTEI